MGLATKNNRVLPQVPEWEIVLKHIVFQDQSLTFRICRKMIIHLERMKIPEIHFLLQELNPVSEQESVMTNGQNWPSPRGNPFVASEVILKVFEIADFHIADDEITDLITLWIQKEKLRNLAKVLDLRNAPLGEVVSALGQYFELGGTKEFTSIDERMGVRVSIISRFLSEDLLYINIAKKYITLLSIEKIFDNIVGPAYGSGKVGGKSAGIILADQILQMKKESNHKLKNVYTAKSWYLTSDGIVEYINYNALDEFTFSKYNPLEKLKTEYPFLKYIFKHSQFTPDAISSFNKILDDLSDNPIVVRSSSLLEDSFEASFTGKYKSLFLSNTGTHEERLNALMDAIAEVYASTFNPEAIEYRKKNGLIDFREEMGIIIMEVVGHRHGKYFMPSYAGVAMSNNEFRWSNRIKRSDGVIRLVLGLGTRAVDRTINDYPALISPGQPDLRLNQSISDKIKYSQRFVDVINLESKAFETVSIEEVIAQSGGDIPGIEKMVSFLREGNIAEPISSMADFESEDLLITFNGLVANTDFVVQIREMLKELSEVYGSPVDLEFASDGEKLYLLQCRPQSKKTKEEDVKVPVNIPNEMKIFSANKYVSNGLVSDIEYVVYVDALGYAGLGSEKEMREVALIVSRLNVSLPMRKFILVGPGRWGSKGDIKLGVPINYSDIHNTSLLIEYARVKQDYEPELSFGSHFFQDLVEADIKYLPLYPDQEENLFNEDFFLRSANSLNDFVDTDKKYLNVVHLIRVSDFANDCNLSIYMDGENSDALAIVKEKNLS